MMIEIFGAASKCNGTRRESPKWDLNLKGVITKGKFELETHSRSHFW
jgi:hypothetical protein